LLELLSTSGTPDAVVTYLGRERRGNNQYYYRKQREGSRVQSVYVGQGEIALLTAQLDALHRKQNEALEVKERQEQRGFESLDQSIGNLAQLSSTLTEAVLICGRFPSAQAAMEEAKA